MATANVALLFLKMGKYTTKLGGVARGNSSTVPVTWKPGRVSTRIFPKNDRKIHRWCKFSRWMMASPFLRRLSLIPWRDSCTNRGNCKWILVISRNNVARHSFFIQSNWRLLVFKLVSEELALVFRLKFLTYFRLVYRGSNC